MRGWMSVVLVAWSVAGLGTEARACEKTAATVVLPATTTLLAPTATGSELLGVPSQREAAPVAPSALMPLAPVPLLPSPMPLASAAPLAPMVVSPEIPWDEIAVHLEELADSQEELQSANEPLERAADWLAADATAPTPPTKKTTRTRTQRHEHTRRGWSYTLETEDEDGGQVRVDTTVTVRKGMTLALENFGGSIENWK